MKTYIGIDPSINSTGVVVLIFDDNNDKVLENLYIIHGGKLKKEEEKYKDKYSYFRYLVYDKEDVKKYKDNNSLKEICKANNLINAVEKIKDIIDNFYNNDDKIHVVMEGISYGSNSSNVCDLAGLNYLIRNLVISYKTIDLYIAPPAEIKKWVTGYGTASKDSMINAFAALHKDFLIPKVDDIADAYFMSCYAKEVVTK